MNISYLGFVRVRSVESGSDRGGNLLKSIFKIKMRMNYCMIAARPEVPKSAKT
jgi:hypothetical protein